MQKRKEGKKEEGRRKEAIASCIKEVIAYFTNPNLTLTLILTSSLTLSLTLSLTFVFIPLNSTRYRSHILI